MVAQWGPRERVDVCPKSQYVWVDRDTGVIGPATTCRVGSCLYCQRVAANKMRNAVELARPSHLLTFTRLSGCWQQDRAAVNRLNQYLRNRDKVTFRMAWAVESNPRSTGYHAHAWAWGDVRFEETLQHRATQVGLGMVDVAPVTRNLNFAYPVKAACHNQASLDEHRRINGSEVIHARGFWRDARTDESLTKEQAFKRAHAIGPRQYGASVLVARDTVGDQHK